MDTRGAWIVGGIVGVLAALLALVLGLIGLVPSCCLAKFANYAVPAGAGLVAGIIAALRADWSEVPADGTTGAGVGLGLRAGGVASAIAGVSFLLVALLMPLLNVVINTLRFASIGDLMTILLLSLGSMVIGAILSLVVAIGSTLLGVGLGAAGGAVVGATRASGDAG